MTLNIFRLALAGLKAGDEILEINNRAAGTLNASVLKDFLAQLSLGLLVRTYPELEGEAELLGSPPLRLDGPADLSENPLAFLTSNTGMAVHRAAPRRLPTRLAYFCGFPASGRSAKMCKMSRLLSFLSKFQRGQELLCRWNCCLAAMEIFVMLLLLVIWEKDTWVEATVSWLWTRVGDTEVPGIT